MPTYHAFEPEEMKAFEAEAKIGLISTINPDGLPHITFISSLRAKTPAQLIWGQFCLGLSKQHVKSNPSTGFLILTLDKRLWRGKARWTHKANLGEDYEMYNNTPMFRYNAYFGINTVHYMDLVETYGKEGLPLSHIVLSSIMTKVARGASATGIREPILKPWAQGLFNRLDALKFLAHVDSDGFPKIIPLLQCQAPDRRRLAFSPLAYGAELNALREGTSVAVFALTTDMEDVLLRGRFQGYDRYRAVTLGTVDIDWVYNSMPPKQGQIYPQEALTPVFDF
jgi:hypothetical protein